ncbi:MAG: hypothetical protein ACIAQF_11060 [Phycisphaerales bacterium JB065]
MQSLFSGSEEEARAAWEAQRSSLEEDLELANSKVDAIDEALDEYREQLSGLDPNSPLASWIIEQIDTTQEKFVDAIAAKERLRVRLDELGTEFSGIDGGGSGLSYGLQATGAAAKAAGDVAPVEVKPILYGASAVLGLLGTIFGGKKKVEADKANKKVEETEETTVQIVKGIEIAKRKNEHLAEAFDEFGGDIQSAMGIKAAAKVNEIRKAA